MYSKLYADKNCRFMITKRVYVTNPLLSNSKNDKDFIRWSSSLTLSYWNSHFATSTVTFNFTNSRFTHKGCKIWSSVAMQFVADFCHFSIETLCWTFVGGTSLFSIVLRKVWTRVIHDNHSAKDYNIFVHWSDYAIGYLDFEQGSVMTKTYKFPT